MSAIVILTMGNDVMRRCGLAVLLALPAAAGCESWWTAGGDLIDYELTLTLREDGSVRVEERAEVRFAEGETRRFALRIPGDRVDGVSGLAATVDGVPVQGPGASPRAEPGGGLVWSDAGSASAVRSFTLAYEARGVLAVRGARGVFTWPAVPAGPGSVARARVRLSWPQGTVPMQGPAVGAAGWDVALEDRTAVMTAREVPRAPGHVAYVDLVLADESVAEPAWQVTDQRARELMPAFVSAGLFLVVVGGGVLVMIRIQYPAPRRGSGRVSASIDDAIVREITTLSAWRAPASTIDRLTAAGLVDPERVVVARGLVWSGVAVLAAAVIVAAAIPVTIGGLGVAPYAVPAGLLVAALLLVIRGVTFPVRTAAGVDVGMLHSRRL
jgi:hypothetical protein